MNKKSQSQLCIETSSVICVSEQEIRQKLFITDLYVYTEIGDKKIIFFAENEEQYLIDLIQGRLVKIDLSAQIAQISQIKKMVGEISIEEETKEQCRCLHFKNVNSSIVNIEAEVEIVEFSGLEQTVFYIYEKFQSALRPFIIPLKANEIVDSMKTCMLINGQNQETTMKLLYINRLEDANQFDNYLGWVSKKNIF